jgi:phosphoribosylformimino-5-aminoimidazole carboxamide ribotide isomerase
VLETLATKTHLVIDFGGGLKTEKDVQIVFECGSAFATVGSMAVKEAEVFTGWLQKFGAQKFMLGADVRDEKLTISGWTEATDIWIYDFIQDYTTKGVQQLFCTDVAKDGALQGPSIELYKNIIAKFPELYFIASGGVSNIDDVKGLQDTGCKGVIIGKAIYEGRVTLEDLKKFAN